MNHFIQSLRKIQLPFLNNMLVYVDLGTSQTRIAIADKGVVLREPTYIGFNKKTHQSIFYGREAKRVMGKVPEFIDIQQPVVNSIIVNFDLAVDLVSFFLKKSIEPYFGKYQIIKPTLHIITSVPVVASEIEQRALEEVMHKVGAAKVTIIERAIATTMGCGYNVFLHEPVCIVDMGGGTIEISIISGGGIVQQKTIKNAGEHMNKLLQNYLYLKHGIMLGESTVEELKIALLDFSSDDHVQEVRGKSLETGLPKSIKVRTSEVKEALQSQLNQIIDAVKELIEVAPPEVVDEIYKAGIVLTGGVAHCPGIDQYLEGELQIPVKKSSRIDTATIQGLMRIGKRADYRDKLRVDVP